MPPQIISDNEGKLTFVPNGDGESAEVNSGRENICVNCGTEHNLSRHHIVPTMFRVHLAEKYRRTRNSIDIVMLCYRCHRDYENMAYILKKELLPDENDAAYYKAARCYRRLKSDIPEFARLRIQSILDGWIEEYGFTEEYLAKHKYDYGTGIKNVIDKYGEVEFIKLWKHHFYDNMVLAFLPDWWSPDSVKIVER